MNECVGRQLDCSDGILPTRIYTHRRDVDMLNSSELAKLPGEEYSFQAVDTGESSFINLIKSHCPAKEIITLKIGAQV
jgi:hypothetical protein